MARASGELGVKTCWYLSLQLSSVDGVEDTDAVGSSFEPTPAFDDSGNNATLLRFCWVASGIAQIVERLLRCLLKISAPRWSKIVACHPIEGEKAIHSRHVEPTSYIEKVIARDIFAISQSERKPQYADGVASSRIFVLEITSRPQCAYSVRPYISGHACETLLSIRYYR